MFLTTWKEVSVLIRIRRETQREEMQQPMEYIERKENILKLNLKRIIVNKIHGFCVAESSCLTFQYFIKTHFY